MNLLSKSRKGFMTLTVLTIASIVLVLVAYAAVTIGTFTGGSVTVLGSATGTVTYSTTNDADRTWTTTLQPGTGPWYTRLEIGAGTYTGLVTVSWQLQKDNGGWGDVSGATQSTTVTLTGSAQNVYASNNGGNATNLNWATLTTGSGTYRVVATVASSP